MSKTVLARCTGLDQALGLDTIEHISPPAIDFQTARANRSVAAEALFREAGVDAEQTAR